MIWIAIALIVYAADISIKWYIDGKYRNGQQKEFFNGNLVVTKVYNYGAPLGKFKKSMDNVIKYSEAVLGALIVLFLCLLPVKKRKLEKFALALIIGGGAQNLYDRSVKKRVLDYLTFPKLPGKLKDIAYNLSDAAIFLGTILITLAGFKPKKKNSENRKAKAVPETGDK